MMNTKTRKLRKRYTPFGYQHSFEAALQSLIERNDMSTIVLSYSSNSWLGEERIVGMLKSVKRDVAVYAIPYTYTFGPHSTALRRQAHELIFVAT